MNHQKIFEEYTVATAKTRYVNEKAKELGVTQSDIICELFKSGYKFDELRRGNPSAYKSALKKFKRWEESGRPELGDDEDVLQSLEQNKAEGKAESTQVEIDTLEANYKKATALFEEAKDYSELKAINNKLKAKISALENELDKAEQEKVHASETSDDYSEAVDKLEETVKELQESNYALEQTNKHQDEQMQILRAKLQDVEQENEKLSMENVSLGETVEGLKKTIVEMTERARGLEEEYEEQFSKTDDVIRLEKELEETTQNYNQAMSRIAELQSELQTVLSDLAAEKAISDKLSKDLRIEREDAETANRVGKELYDEKKELIKKLGKAEQYILKSLIYS